MNRALSRTADSHIVILVFCSVLLLYIYCFLVLDSRRLPAFFNLAFFFYLFSGALIWCWENVDFLCFYWI